MTLAMQDGQEMLTDEAGSTQDGDLQGFQCLLSSAAPGSDPRQAVVNRSRLARWGA
jgi:hypothetical protein